MTGPEVAFEVNLKSAIFHSRCWHEYSTKMSLRLYRWLAVCRFKIPRCIVIIANKH